MMGRSFHSFLLLLNRIDERVYRNCKKSTIKKPNYDKIEKLKKRAYQYVYDNHKDMLPKNRFTCVQQFQSHLKSVKRKLHVAGLILVNEDNKVLCVVNYNDQVNFPKGKEELCDGGKHHLTALREAAEEAGVHLTDEEFERSTRYIEIELVFYEDGEPIVQVTRLYILLNFTRVISLQHKQPWEIKRVMWLGISEINLKKYRFLDDQGRKLKTTELLRNFAQRFQLETIDRDPRVKEDLNCDIQSYRDLKTKVKK